MKDKNFWSVRVNLDIRIIVHRTDKSLLLCYVDHHDDAYAWAEKRKIETHPKTGAAQLVEIRERVREIIVPVYTQEEVQAPASQLEPVFEGVSDGELLGYGVPVEWLDDVKAATEETILEIADHLPGEAAEALLNLATGTKPEALAQTTVTDPFAHPDAQRRFRVLTNKEELEQALEYPWEKWSVFLHPAQRNLVEREYNGPARISGSAGTGKTIVALHRAAHLARSNPNARVLLTTFSKPLAYALRLKLGYLVGNQPNVSERIEVQHVDGIAYELYSKAFEQPNLATDKMIRSQIAKAVVEVEGHKFTEQFCWNEWRDVVDAWQLRNLGRISRRTAPRS